MVFWLEKKVAVRGLAIMSNNLHGLMWAWHQALQNVLHAYTLHGCWKMEPDATITWDVSKLHVLMLLGSRGEEKSLAHMHKVLLITCILLSCARLWPISVYCWKASLQIGISQIQGNSELGMHSVYQTVFLHPWMNKAKRMWCHYQTARLLT